MTDTQALKALAAEGFRWQQALSHGVNNCLIDSLMLCLAYEGLLPSNLGADVAARRRSAVACRKHLVQAVGQAVLPSAKGFFPYLDAHRDGPHIVTFLLQRFRAVARANMIIRVHDRFGECTADPDRNKILVHLGFEHPEHHALQLHIYNHTSVQGRGYHFDSLLRQTTVRETEPTVETDSTRTSANIDRTEKDVDRRAEAVFAKLAWRLCGSSFDIPWLEALLLNLLFHGYLSMGPSVMASQKARHQLCRSCQRHLKLEPKPDEAEAQTFDLQSHLAAAIFFLLGTSYKSVNADVYVHDASTTDLNVPRDSYRIGPPDSLLVPIFRLYCFQNGQYAALLPLLVSAAACCCLLLPAAACCCLPAAPCCCLLLVLLLVAAAAAVVLLQSNSLQSKKQTARHPFRNTSETAKHHLISCPKRSKGTPKKGLTSLLKPYYKIATLPLPAAACCCLLLPAAASAGVCCAAACCCLCWCLLLPAAACCCLQLPAAACGCLQLLACCSLLLPAAGAAAGGCCCCYCGAAVVLLQSNSLQSKKQTARHPFRNTSETAKHHLISYPKRSKGTPKKGLTSLLKPYLKLQLCRCLPLPAAACRCLLLPLLVSAAACCCLLLPGAACCYLLLPAAACLLLLAAACCWCCCWWLLLLLWCCCNQTASKARNKQPDTLFETYPKQQNTT